MRLLEETVVKVNQQSQNRSLGDRVTMRPQRTDISRETRTTDPYKCDSATGKEKKKAKLGHQ